MKHIKKIDDIIFEKLYKSTYLDAHNKLKNLHPDRSSKLKEWGDQQGTSEFSKNEVDRVWPHKFVLHNNSLISHAKENFLGYFSITGMYLRDSVDNNPYLYVQMMNDYGQKVEICLDVFQDKQHFQLRRIVIRWGLYDYTDSQSGDSYIRNKYMIDGFLFNNRKDALQFKRYLIEEGLPDIDAEKGLQKFISSIRVNDLYTTK